MQVAARVQSAPASSVAATPIATSIRRGIPEDVANIFSNLHVFAWRLSMSPGQLLLSGRSSPDAARNASPGSWWEAWLARAGAHQSVVEKSRRHNCHTNPTAAYTHVTAARANEAHSVIVLFERGLKVNFRRLLVTTYAVRLLLQGRQGEAIVAELRDWSGPRRSTYRVAAAIVVAVAALGLALCVTGERGSAATSTELAKLPIVR